MSPKRLPSIISPADDAVEEARARLTQREIAKIEAEVELIGKVVDELMRDSARFRVRHMKWRAKQIIARADRATGRH
jgi:hypothetical protein